MRTFKCALYSSVEVLALGRSKIAENRYAQCFVNNFHEPNALLMNELTESQLQSNAIHFRMFFFSFRFNQTNKSLKLVYWLFACQAFVFEWE